MTLKMSTSSISMLLTKPILRSRRCHSTFQTLLPKSPLVAFMKDHRSNLRMATASIQKPGPLVHDRKVSQDFRKRCREGLHNEHTSGYARGFVQANFVALPKEFAYEFLVFTLRNPRSCPLLAVTSPGDPEVSSIAPGSDLRFDIPRYKIFRDGVPDAFEPTSIENYWDSNMVGFLLGCSFSWEQELAQDPKLLPKNVKYGRNVSMFNTNIPNTASGVFGGNLVVSMRPYHLSVVDQVNKVTNQFPGAHGGPIHWGDPNALGIRSDFGIAVDYGDVVDVGNDEIPVFWACGVTPQSALQQAKIPFAITHSPGYMFVTDLLDDHLRSAKPNEI